MQQILHVVERICLHIAHLQSVATSGLVLGQICHVMRQCCYCQLASEVLLGHRGSCIVVHHESLRLTDATLSCSSASGDTDYTNATALDHLNLASIWNCKVSSWTDFEAAEVHSNWNWKAEPFRNTCVVTRSSWPQSVRCPWTTYT